MIYLNKIKPNLFTGTEHSKAMETLKGFLAKAPALGHPNYDLPFFLFVHEKACVYSHWGDWWHTAGSP